MNDERKNITISAELFNIISERIKNSSDEFSSVEEYVNYVLKEILSESESSQSLSQDEEEEIKEKLKTLGYM